MNYCVNSELPVLQANLHALIQLKPAVSHLGDKGLLLLLRCVHNLSIFITSIQLLI